MTMSITIQLTGLDGLTEAINHLADSLVSAKHADTAIASAVEKAVATTRRSKKTEAAPTPAEPEAKEAPAPEPAKAEPTKVEPAPAPAPEVASAADADAVKKAILGLCKAKGHDTAAALLAKFGASKLSEVKETDFAAVIEAARAA